MPTQTVNENRVKFYAQWDEAPDLEDTLTDSDGNVIDLTGWDVYITVAHVIGDPFNHVTDPLIDHSPVTVTDAANGKVAWTPHDLRYPGMFYYSYTLWDSGTSSQRTVRSLSYDYIRVQAPPGGRTRAPWSPS